MKNGDADITALLILRCFIRYVGFSYLGPYISKYVSVTLNYFKKWFSM